MTNLCNLSAGGQIVLGVVILLLGIVYARHKRRND